MTRAEHSRARAPSLVCPSCKGALGTRDGAWECAGCGAEWPIHDGIASFAAGQPFYDDYLEEHCPFVENPPAWKRLALRALPYWSWREWSFFKSHLEPGDRVLDLGCARGKEWFTESASFVAGIDPSLPSLRECARHYDLVARAKITALPFPDEAFDVVVTSHVIGHIPFDEKDRAVSEMARVLRPGGRSLNIVETDSNGAFATLGKEDPALYERNFIETDGHVGLELPSAVVERFGRHGLNASEVRKMEARKVHLRYYEKYLGIGYPERNDFVQRKIDRWRRVSSNRVLLGCYEVWKGADHRFVEQRRAPLDASIFIALCAVKA